MNNYRGRQPIEDSKDDSLGFSEMANQLAASLANDPKFEDGIVLGLEGKWGSGKTSLLQLTQNALKEKEDNSPIVVDFRLTQNALKEKNSPIVVDFRPWLIKDRDALIALFFAELSTAIATKPGENASDVKRMIGGYAGRLIGVGSTIADLAASAEVPLAKPVQKTLDVAQNIVNEENNIRPLAEIKSKLDEKLKKLDRRIIVTIDDVDRLEPREVSEILRLVRAVADFGSIIYILCYDPKIIAEAICKDIGVSQGRAFLEKIVQISIPIPRPEPFALRNMLHKGLDQFAKGTRNEAIYRLESVMDYSAGLFLQTPRDVNRVLDSVEYFWPALSDKVDLADMVWLQMVRGANPELYYWIEEYCMEMAAAADGNTYIPDGQKKKRMADELDSIFKQDRELQDDRFRVFLDGILPGTQIFDLIKNDEDQQERKIFMKVDPEVKNANIQAQRLASPDHFRLYFALANPTGAFTETEQSELLSAADIGHADVNKILAKWFSEKTIGGGIKAVTAIARLADFQPSGLNAKRSAMILRSLADVMDTDVKNQGRGWHEAEKLLQVLRARIGENATDVTKAAFEDGKAIGWLVDLLRRETFAHGIYGNDKRPESKWLFDEKEFTSIANILKTRFEKMTFEQIFQTPRPGELLCGWSQVDDNGQIRKKFREDTSEDTQFVKFIDAWSNQVSSSSRNYFTRQKENINLLLPYDKAIERLAKIQKNNAQLKDQVEDIFKKIKAENRF